MKVFHWKLVITKGYYLPTMYKMSRIVFFIVRKHVFYSKFFWITHYDQWFTEKIIVYVFLMPMHLIHIPLSNVNFFYSWGVIVYIPYTLYVLMRKCFVKSQYWCIVHTLYKNTRDTCTSDSCICIFIPLRIIKSLCFPFPNL